MCLAAHDWKFRRWTTGNVKLLLPPRQSRGNSHFVLDRQRQLYEERIATLNQEVDRLRDQIIVVGFLNVFSTILTCAICVLLVRRKLSLLQESKRELQLALKQAQAATEAKSNFLATMSHEIRTPMNGIIAMTDHLLEWEKRTEERQILKIISTSSEHLLAVINDILDFSKLEARAIELELRTFDLLAMTKNVADMFSVKATEKGLSIDVRFESDVPQWVIGDEARIRQILLNLISNAIKFTKRGGVTLDVTGGQMSAEPASVKFVVRDTGIGMSPEALTHLFSEFWQADTSISRQFGGTGLGMAISHRLAKAMGGSITAESILGEGTTFSVILPVELPAENAIPTTAQDSEYTDGNFSFAGRHILLVEDNPTNQKIAKTILVRTGIKIDTANNGVEAVTAASANDYDLVLMDIHMPLMNGLEATQAIRALRNARSSVPIIALSASAFKEDRERALEVGMNDTN